MTPISTTATPLNVGALLFPGFELLDIYGPLEMLGLLGDQVSITMLAAETGEITSSAGPKGVAETTLSEAGAMDLLLIPGGIGTRALVNNPSFINSLCSVATYSTTVATICTGSALLARTGLLDGCKATSNKLVFDWVMEQGAKVDWVRKARWVKEEKFFTSSGISAGIDMTLAMIAHFYGRATSLEVATKAEYQWNENPLDDPFA